VVGKHESLFSDGYVEAYCGPDLGDDTERFKPLVDDLKVINDRLTELGRPFLFLITPSKAAAMPEAMPIGSCITNKARGRELKHLVAELRAAGVPVVNGPALTKKRKKHDPIPPFPRGGIHWSLGVGDHVARQVMLELARIARQDLGSVKITGTQWDAPPVGSDRDLAELLNLLAAPADYPTARNDVACRLTDAGKSTELRVVGGSFANTIFRKLDECQFFSPATMHFYYWDEPGTVDWKEILSRRSVLIVELNEVYLGRPDPKAWLPKFFDDIIPVLEQM
jgi:hypothetical protein